METPTIFKVNYFEGLTLNKYITIFAAQNNMTLKEAASYFNLSLLTLNGARKKKPTTKTYAKLLKGFNGEFDVLQSLTITDKKV